MAVGAIRRPFSFRTRKNVSNSCDSRMAHCRKYLKNGALLPN